MSSLREYFEQEQFCILFERLAGSQEPMPPSVFAGFSVGITLADRVHSDEDASPLDMAIEYPTGIKKLVHYSGKGRDLQDFVRFLQQAKLQGLHDVLLLSGDKLKNHQDGFSGQPRSRYLESVNAVVEAKNQGDFHIGVAFNPFKYTQVEKEAQYFKLHKKIQAGADFIITQLGYDLSALQAVHTFLDNNQYHQKLLACVMPLTLARANFMITNKVAGIVITPHIIDVLKQDQAEGKPENAYARCALHILICKHFGFSGVHLSACQKSEEQVLLERYLDEYKSLDLSACINAWNAIWCIENDNQIPVFNDVFNQLMPRKSVIKYRFMKAIHDVAFHSNVAKKIGNYFLKLPIFNNKFSNSILYKTELVLKDSLVGCEGCGQCRLDNTLYICPETCPKGLANGPCGGTSLDVCEFGDRTCIHSVKANLAIQVSQTDILKDKLIPAVPFDVRGQSSWKNWFVHSSSGGSAQKTD